MIKMIRNAIGGVFVIVAVHVPPAWIAEARGQSPAQIMPAPLIPNLVSHGTGVVEMEPDRVELLVRVESRASNAAQATDQNARTAQAVIDSLRRGFQLGEQDVTTLGVNVRQELTYPGDGRPPRVTGYVATNTLRVRTSQTRRVGAILDAAVAKGATEVHGPNFFLADSSDARRQALTRAVAQAKRDAEAMALAAGGALGELMEMTSEPPGQGPYPMQRMASLQAARADAETPVEASDLRISAGVVAKWRFIRPNR